MPPPKTIEVRVIPRNLRWEVSVNGLTRRLIDWLCTKDRAIEHAFERAEELIRCEPATRAVVVVESLDHNGEKTILVAPRQHTSRGADESSALREPSSSEAFTHKIARSG